MAEYAIAIWGRGPHHALRQGNAGVTLCGMSAHEYVGYRKIQQFHGDFNEITCRDCRNMYMQEIGDEWKEMLATIEPEDFNG